MQLTYTTRAGPYWTSCRKKDSSQPFRGGSSITTVSSAGEVIEAKRRAASAAMNCVEDLGRLFSSALVVALAIDDEEISIPKEDLKREERVMVKSPEPEYASMR